MFEYATTILRKVCFVKLQTCDWAKFQGFTQFCKWNLRLKFQVMSMTPCFLNLH
jgi:hypothetical protein